MLGLRVARVGVFTSVACMIVLLLAWLTFARIGSKPMEGPPRSVSQQEDGSPASLVLPETERDHRVEPLNNGTRTIEDVLAEYWGDQWPAIKAGAGDQSLDFTQAAGEEPPPWEEIRPEIVARFEATAQGFGRAWQDKYLWPNETTASVLAERLGFATPVTSYTLQLAHSAAMAHQDSIRNQIERKQDVLSQAFEEVILQDRLDRSPYFLQKSTLGVNNRGPSQFASSLSYQGWSIAVTVPRTDFPLLEEVSTELKRLCRIRDRAVRQTL